MLPYLQMANWKALKNIPQVCPTSSSSWIFHVIAHCPQVSVVLHLLSPPSFTVPSWFYLAKEGYLHFRDPVVQLYDLCNSLSFKEMFGSIHFINIYEFTMIYTHIFIKSPFILALLPVSRIHFLPIIILFNSHSFCLVLCMRRNTSWFFLCFGIFCLTWYGWVNPFATSHKILFFLRNK